jgi:uncharacterized protein YbcI
MRTAAGLDEGSESLVSDATPPGGSRVHSYGRTAVPESALAVTAADSGAAEADREARRVSVLAEISTEMVKLFKEQFGRGPTVARAAWAGEDTLVVVLEDTLTPAERNLVKLGEHERLRETRSFFQYASVREFCEPIERLTGRTVRAFTSAIDTEVEGLSVEAFILHPAGSDLPSRAKKAGARPPGPDGAQRGVSSLRDGPS